MVTNPPAAAVHLEPTARIRPEMLRNRALEQRARDLLEAAPDAIVVVDAAGHIVLLNSQTEILFGYQREELLGQPVELLVPERVRGAHHGKREQFTAHPAKRPMGLGMELAGRRKDGSEVPVEISLSPLHTEEGVFVSAAIRDISDRRAAEKALRQARDELEVRVQARTAELADANRALKAEVADRHEAERALYQAQKMEAVGQLTGGVAHDFNNLLTVVMGNLQLLAHVVTGNVTATELIEAALKAARRGAELNRTLLAFSRKQRLAPVSVDFNEMIRGMTGMLQRTLGEQVRISVVEAKGLPRAMADPAQLETALLNLMLNARDAMPEGGTVTIETDSATLDEHYAALEPDVRPGRYVMLAVSDTGVGMAREVVARAFEPFFTTKETGKGSGLGLAMVYGFVKQSGGHVKIYSEIGQGTTVKVFLPEGAPPARPGLPQASPAAAVHTGRETILVVEDDPDVRLLASRLLTTLGYRVLEAVDGQSALALMASTGGIDLLFTDVVLPGGMNGPDLARQAQARWPGVKVVYTSGYTGSAIQQLDARASDVKMISKPYAVDDLARIIRSTLDG